MARELDAQEPLLTAVARKLGQAAGTLVNMTQRLTTEPALPESQSASTPNAINRNGPKKRVLPFARIRQPKSVAQLQRSELQNRASPLPATGLPRNEVPPENASAAPL